MSDPREKSAWDKMMKAHAAWDSHKSQGVQSSQPKLSMKGVQKGQRNFEPDDKSPSGLRPAQESGVGSVMGFQMPGNLVKRKRSVDEMLKQSGGFNEQMFTSFVQSLPEGGADELCSHLDSRNYEAVVDKMKEYAIREIIKKKVREVVRKKPGGGGYVLYAPNRGKKGKAKAVGNFPTRLGARRAELSRFPPKDPEKLKRLRKAIDRQTKDPKKAADAEKKSLRKEAIEPVPGSQSSIQTKKEPTTSTPKILHKDPASFVAGLKTLPKDGPERGKYVTSHMSDPTFMGALQKHPQGKDLHKMMMGFLNSKRNAGPTGAKVTVAGTAGESVNRRKDFMERKIISTVIYKSLVEGIFREEQSKGSDWDEYITKLSKNALAGDKKFQNLQRGIAKKEDVILDDAFNSIRKAVGKIAKLKSFGVKKDGQTSKTYLAFAADFDGATVEPILIHINNGTPHIEVTDNARVGLTKIEPSEAKMFRAELVTVQEGILDEMDDLTQAVSNRDKYLQKLEGGVDAYVSGLSPLQVSLLKRLLVSKYRKIS